MAWKEAIKLKSDVICFQETHFMSHKPPPFHHQKFPHVYVVIGPKKKGGVAIAVRDSIPFTELGTHLDASGRYIILICEIFKTK